MTMKITDALKDKRILIWGYGREGKSTETFIKDHVEVRSLEVYEGERDGFDIEKYDLVIKSPGIPYFSDDPRFTSQTVLFLNEFRDRTIGITGTKGKSTTSALMYEAIRAAGKKVILLGNIGRPCLDWYDEIEKDTFIVFELSCHQLAKLEKAPKYAIFLNLFEEHLDYYGTLDRYFKAKANITLCQEPGDVVLLGENVPELKTKAEKHIINKLNQDYTLQIPGAHNKLNAEFVRTMTVDILGLDLGKVIEGMENFKGLDHRLQFVTKTGNVSFYDDSISTIPEAAISAAGSVPDTRTMLIGGKDRGIDYSKLVAFIKSRKDINFILMYATGERIFSETGALPNVIKVTDLDEAVKTAKQITKDGAVLLSPAAASYGYFKNFEERGDRFKELVRE